MNAAPYDAIVVGGGPAGAVAAATLARDGWRVRLVEQRQRRKFKVGESLVPAARVILEEIGALDALLNGGHLPCYGNQSAWGVPHLQDNDFIRSPHGHGWHLDRALFDEQLIDHAAREGVEVDMGTRLTSLQRSSGLWSVRLTSAANTTSLQSRWLLDSSGRRRRVVRSLAVPCLHLDSQVAYVTRFHSTSDSANRDTDGTTLVEAVRQGWWYTARLPGDRRVVIFFTDNHMPWSESVRRTPGFSELLAKTRVRVAY